MNIDSHAIAHTAMSLSAAQIEDELRQAIELVAPLEPSVIVEIGCYRGGTLYAWRQLCERVYGITLLEDWKYDGGGTQPLNSHGAVVHLGSSHDPASLEWLKGELGGSPVDVLVIDADHRFEQAKSDLVTYAPLVRPGGLVLLHDVLYKYPAWPDPEFHVWRLWEQVQEHFDTSVTGTVAGWGVIRVQQGDDFASAGENMTFESQDQAPDDTA